MINGGTVEKGTYVHIVESFVDVFQALVVGHKLVYPEFTTEIIFTMSVHDPPSREKRPWSRDKERERQ